MSFIYFNLQDEKLAITKKKGESSISLDNIDWVIINIGEDAEWQWAESIIRQARKADCAVYLLPGPNARPKEFPAFYTLEDAELDEPFFTDDEEEEIEDIEQNSGNVTEMDSDDEDFIDEEEMELSEEEL